MKNILQTSMTTSKAYYLFTALFVAFAISSSLATHTVLLQGFNLTSYNTSEGYYNWLYKHVIDINNAGITDILLPPPSNALDAAGYLPAKLYDLNSSLYGNQTELKRLIGAFNDFGIKAIVDTVINHRMGVKRDKRGVLSIFEGGTNDSRLDWGTSFICGDDKQFGNGEGNLDTGEAFIPAPDIDHLNPTVQAELSDWINWLINEIGFVGLRLDFIKGYSANITKIYINNTKPDFVVGDFWSPLLTEKNGTLKFDQYRHKLQLRNYIQGAGGELTLFDFTTQGILRTALSENELWRLKDPNNKSPGLMGIMPANAVTFIDNHNTYSKLEWKNWKFPTEKVMQGYAYILTHAGIPTVFLNHLLDSAMYDRISDLVTIRARNGVSSTSKVLIMTAESDLYMAKIDNKIIVKIGPKMNISGSIPDDFKLSTHGNEYAVWEKQATNN